MIGVLDILDMPVCEKALQVLLFALDLLYAALRHPLERSERLRHEARDADGDAQVIAPLDLVIELVDAVRQIGDALQVFIRFRWKAHHEVELHLFPAIFEGIRAGAHDVFLRDALIDDIAHTLRTGFRCQCETALSDLLDLFRNVDGEAVDTQ